MFNQIFLAIAVLFISVQSRPARFWVFRDGDLAPTYVIEDPDFSNDNNFTPRYFGSQVEEALPNYLEPDVDAISSSFEDQPSYIRRTRQVQGSTTLHVPSQKLDLAASVPVDQSDKHALSAFGTVSGIKTDQLGSIGKLPDVIKSGSFDSIGAGLNLETAKGHGLTAMASHIPTLGNELTAAGKLNLVNTPAHKLDANAFASRTFSSNPEIPNFNSYGGNLDYMYREKIGATLGARTIPAFERTDLSAMGKLNIYKTPTSSFDFGAGVVQTRTPFQSVNQPQFDLTWTKRW